MSSALDMSLDDLIKNNKKSSNNGGGGGGRGGRGRGSSGPGPSRRFPRGGGNRTTPYSLGKPVQAPDSAWQHDMYAAPFGIAAAFPAQGGRSSALETGTKLYISNLDYGVSNEDIKELFSEVGDLKRHGVHYDKSGRSKGTAEVVFSRRSDASAAFKRYNNVALDGKPMKIEIVVTNVETPAILPLVANGMYGHPNVIPRGQPRARASSRLTGGGGRGNFVGGGNNNFGGGRGAGRGRGRGRGRSDQVVSATDLDADLEKYHAESMQIN
ncbi:hypothetical protein ACHQM5_021453 [Ranunculus cassubicifolius]